MSIEDLRHSIARHIRDAIPGHSVEEYLRAARAVSNLWRSDEFAVGYRQGKEVGLAESTNGAEVASLRERLKRYESATPAEIVGTEPALDFGDWEATA